MVWVLELSLNDVNVHSLFDLLQEEWTQLPLELPGVLVYL